MEIALKEFPKLSDSELARICAVNHKTVAAARPVSVGISQPEKRIGADGKSYPATKPARAPVVETPAPEQGKPVPREIVVPFVVPAQAETKSATQLPFCVATVWRFRLQRRDGAQSGGRTHTAVKPQDFESSASANSAIRAIRARNKAMHRAKSTGISVAALRARIPEKSRRKVLHRAGEARCLCALSKVRAVAQTGSALAWGARGREFKSHRPDHLETMTVIVYVLRGVRTGRRYVGITNCLARRLEEHSRGSALSSKILGEFELLLSEEYLGYAQARVRERYLKSGQGRAYLDARFGRRSPS